MNYYGYVSRISADRDVNELLDSEVLYFDSQVDPAKCSKNLLWMKSYDEGFMMNDHRFIQCKRRSKLSAAVLDEMGKNGFKESDWKGNYCMMNFPVVMKLEAAVKEGRRGGQLSLICAGMIVENKVKKSAAIIDDGSGWKLITDDFSCANEEAFNRIREQRRLLEEGGETGLNLLVLGLEELR